LNLLQKEKGKSKKNLCAWMRRCRDVCWTLGRVAAVVVPLGLGLPLAADGAVAIYAGYASAWWPSAPATVTRFSAEPVVVVKHQPSPPTQHTVGDEGDRTAMPTPEGQGGRSSQPASLLAAARTWALSWAQQPINRLRYSEHTLDFTIEFEYTLPDG